MTPETLTACTTCATDTYLLWAVLVPAVVAHVLPHLSPETQARLGIIAKIANAIVGNYRHAKNAKPEGAA